MFKLCLSSASTMKHRNTTCCSELSETQLAPLKPATRMNSSPRKDLLDMWTEVSARVCSSVIGQLHNHCLIWSGGMTKRCLYLVTCASCMGVARGRCFVIQYARLWLVSWFNIAIFGAVYAYIWYRLYYIKWTQLISFNGCIWCNIYIFNEIDCWKV